jgi:hypothetical protein
MDLTQIVERLSGRIVGAKYVKYAASIAIATEDVKKQTVGDCWIYVTPSPESASESELATDGEDDVAVDQLVAINFDAYVFLKNVSTNLGAKSHDVLEPIRKGYRDRLLGWVPLGCEAPIQFASGAPAGFSDYVSVWRDGFRTKTRYIANGTYDN